MNCGPIARKSFLKPLITTADTNGVRSCGRHFFMRPVESGITHSHSDVVTESEAMKANEQLNPADRPVSRTFIGLLLIAAVASTGSGCRLCCDSEDIAYGAYGGVWERTNRDSGRVGSLFDAGGARVSSLSPRDSVENVDDQRSRIIPLEQEEDRRGEPTEDPTDDSPEPKSDSETDQEFQDRLKKFEAERMLNAKVIPGNPIPPDHRF